MDQLSDPLCLSTSNFSFCTPFVIDPITGTIYNETLVYFIVNNEECLNETIDFDCIVFTEWIPLLFNEGGLEDTCIKYDELDDLPPNAAAKHDPWNLDIANNEDPNVYKINDNAFWYYPLDKDENIQVDVYVVDEGGINTAHKEFSYLPNQ